MTLEIDDLQLSKVMLDNRDDWFDESSVHQFENEFSVWNGSRHVFAFMGGRVALSACLAGLGLEPSSEVIVPAYTCVVVPNAIRFAGLKPVYADIELETYGLRLDDIRRKATKDTKAVLIQHLYGLVSKEFMEIIAWAKQNNIAIIEDCAHSTGATYQGTKVGNFGDAAFYSCEQSKLFNTTQGGVAVTNDAEIATRMKNYHDKAPLPTEQKIEHQLKTHMINYYSNKDPMKWLLSDWKCRKLSRFELISTTDQEINGNRPNDYGCKMPGVIARLGLNQLGKIDRFNALRVKTAKRWDMWCDEQFITKPTVIPDSNPVFLRYPILVPSQKKQNRSWAVRELGVELGVWFVSQVHPSIVSIPNCPNSEIAVEQCVNLPTILR